MAKTKFHAERQNKNLDELNRVPMQDAVIFIKFI